MRMSGKEFLDWDHKAISLLGMSGVGKTTLASKLPSREWFHYSADYRIGTKYLEEPILDNVKKKAMEVDYLRDLLRTDSIYIRSNITVHNLAPVSTFLGKVGNPDLGGLSVAEFKERQRLHHDAEVGAMADVCTFIAKAQEIYGYAHFINDAGGSVCELRPPEVLATLAGCTLILYIRADQEMEEELIRRAVQSPKPLYYDEQFLDEQLRAYMQAEGLAGSEAIDPDHFVRWIFPRLVEHRRPLYESIADRYGYAVSAREVEQVRDEHDIVELIAAVLDRRASAVA